MRGDRRFWILIALYAAVALLAGARELLDYDSAQLALAIDQHDVRLHQPQPPGFVLYIWCVSLVRALVVDTFWALRIVALAFVLAAAWTLRRLGTLAYDRATGNVAAVLFLTSPLVLFHSMATMMYGAEAWIAVLVALLAFRAMSSGQRRQLMILGFVAGLLGGLRQPTLVFGAPLLLLTFFRGRFGSRDFLAAAIAMLLGTVSWMIPQIDHAGSLGDYLAANAKLQAHIFATSPLRKPAEIGDVLHRAANVFVFGVGAWRLLATGMVRWRLGRREHPVRLDTTFYFIWTFPALLVHLFYHFARPGYALVYWPALSLLLAGIVVRGARACRSTSGRRRFGLAMLTATSLDSAMFFLLPTSHIGREPWELAAPHVQYAGLRGFWHDLPLKSDWVARLSRAVFGRVNFFYDRCHDFRFGGFFAAMHQQGFPRPDVLLIGRSATRVACYGLPGMWIVHSDPLRPNPYVSYRNRHAEPVHGTFELPAGVETILIETTDGQLFVGGALVGKPLPSPLGGFLHFECGSGAVDALYRPHLLEGAPVETLRIRRSAQQPE